MLTELYIIKKIYRINSQRDDFVQIIKPSLIAACKEVVGQAAASKMKGVPLSNDTVERRVSDMAEDTETQITEKIKKSKLLALQLDESTDIQNNSNNVGTIY